MRFIGRKKELEDLNLLHKKKSASFVVVHGRRRIGKSRLIQEFTKGKNSWVFSGIPPVKGITKQRQIDTFATQMSQNLQMPKLKVTEWSDIFWHLGTQAKDRPIIIVLDEISWMASKDPDFLGHLKNAWDLYFSRNPKLILIVCGSVSSWIAENILSSTGFLGRISLDLMLEELPLVECQEFWEGKKISSYEKFKLLSVTGGIPKYLEEVIPEEPAEANIHRMCFQPAGLLFREFDQIFSDLFSKKSPTYRKIVQTLSGGALTLSDICQALKIEKGGAISKYLKNLVLAGFVTVNNTWNLENKKMPKVKHFRLSDNYLRFYAKYIEPNKEKIEMNLFDSPSLAQLPAWETIMGFQFENLVLSNLKRLFQILKIDSRDVVMAGPFVQQATKRKKGCQIDLLIQTKHRSLYLCEIKFHANPVKKDVIEEIQEKIDRIALPRSYSVRSVLIHVNGVNPGVTDSEFLSHIVDFSEFFQ